MDEETKRLTSMIDVLIEKKIKSYFGPGWAYGQVTAVTPGSNTSVTLCTVLLDGYDSIQNVKCLEHVIPHVNDYVLTMPVNGFSGDRVIIGITKSAYEPGTILEVKTANIAGVGDFAFSAGGYSLITDGGSRKLEITYVPAVDCIPLAILHAAYYHGSNSVSVGLQAFCNGIIDIRQSDVTQTAGWSIGMSVIGFGAVMSGGVSYTFEGRYYNNAGLLYISQLATNTWFHVAFISKVGIS